MNRKGKLQLSSQTEPKHLHRLLYLEHVCVFLAGIIAFVNLLSGKAFSASNIASQEPQNLILSWAAVCAVVALFCSDPTHSKRLQRLGRCFAMLVIGVAAFSLVGLGNGSLNTTVHLLNGSGSVQENGSFGISAVAFLMSGFAIFFFNTSRPILRRISDGVAICLFFLVLTLVFGFLFDLMKLPPLLSSSVPKSVPVLWCLAAITLAIAFRQAEDGILSVVAGYGIGSRIARILVPIMFVMPFSRELARAHLLSSGLFPIRYVTAFLTATATIIGLGLAVILAQKINQLQDNIQSLTLRDELTGLHSVRGFYFLAEQAFRVAKRTEQPFSVLFVDMDNLKIINDKLGHSAGSIALVETAKLLMRYFRETDIIGRVGGDEFVVAGQLNGEQVANTIQRVRAAASQINEAARERFTISLSIGCATTDQFSNLTLKGLVAAADEAMYREKRAKKLRTSVEAQADLAAT